MLSSRLLCAAMPLSWLLREGQATRLRLRAGLQGRLEPTAFRPVQPAGKAGCEVEAKRRLGKPKDLGSDPRCPHKKLDTPAHL